MNALPTYCESCDNRHPERKEDMPWGWRCLKVPVRPGYGYVSSSYSPSPPYARCQDVNRYGECELFEPLRVAPEKVDA